MDPKSKNKWTNKFRELGKNKGSRKDFVNLYKEMKKEKDKKKVKEKYTKDKSWKDLIEND